uniref:Uncharacterized protein n=1 Tax=Rousettus aegyptiacus TaxID=9407 RepID=A0A7J8EKA0_ROUAE|nr:hypothetical protein HJG63_012546 [Rousettus aegyptiacus]
MPPASFLYLRMDLAIRGLLCFHTNLMVFSFISLKNFDVILIGITLNLYNDLVNIVILTMLTFPFKEHEISFHFFVSSISFNRRLQFSLYMYFTHFIKFIPRYFIIFVVIAKGIIFSSFFFLTLHY